MEYRYQFEKSPKKKGICPGCNRKNEFRFMFDTITGERLPDEFGRCERANNCNYIKTPTKENYSKHFLNSKESNYNSETKYKQPIKPQIKMNTKFIEYSLVARSKSTYNLNNLILWLTDLFGDETVNSILESYHLGTSKDNNGTIFWYCDIENNFRTGKIISYKTDGHRNKEINPFYIHSKIEVKENECFKMCLFGEHLLNLPENLYKTVAIVESEKSAILGSIFLKDFVWIASGGAKMLTTEKMEILKNRKIILIPDTDEAGRISFEKKANEFNQMDFNIDICDIAPNLNNGEDVADFLINEHLKNIECLKLYFAGFENYLIECKSNNVNLNLAYSEVQNLYPACSLSLENFRAAIINLKLL